MSIPNINVLIELKYMFNEELIDKLKPYISTGLQNIYNLCKMQSNNTSVLTHFQTHLNNVKKWNENTKIKCKDSIKDTDIQKLLNTLIKINNILFNISNDKNIDMTNYIYLVYIQAAKEFYSKPFLFYHDYPPIEIKRNKVIISQILDKCIISAMRKYVLNKESFDDIDKYLQKILENNVASNQGQNQVQNQVQNQDGGGINNEQKILEMIDKNLKLSESNQEILFKDLNHSTHRYSTKQKSYSHSTQNSSRNSKNNHRNSSRNTSFNGSSKDPIEKYSNKSSDTLKKIINKSFDNNDNSTSRNTNNVTNNVDSSIKRQLIKDLDSDTMTYNPDDKYQDIFSNSEMPNNNKLNNSKKISSEKNKFFNEYLKN